MNPRIKFVSEGYQLTREEITENRAGLLIVVCKLLGETDEEASYRLWGRPTLKEDSSGNR